ncbi:MAG: type II secretion system protein GspL [Burkholderiaceae bacterium]
MAAKTLRRGEAIVWLPPRSAGESALNEGAALTVIMGGMAETHPRRMSLEALQGVRSLWLVLDARDSTILAVSLPPLKGARLLQALPNAVEEHLLQDPAECLLAIGPEGAPDQPRLVAAADREWVDVVLSVFESRGHRIMALWPAAQALPHTIGGAVLGCVNQSIMLAIGDAGAIGWPAPQAAESRRELLEHVLQMSGLHGSSEGTPAPEGLTAWVDHPDWIALLQEIGQERGLKIKASLLEASFESRLDLLDARPARARRMLTNLDLATLRLPAGLALACLLVWIAGLNLHWWQLLREREDAREKLEATFRAAVPTAQVVVDPLLQMNRHVASLSAAAGLPGAQDALPLMGRFADALGPQAADALAAIDYSEGRLRVRFRPERVESRAAREQLQASCERAGLQLRFDGDREPMATVTPGV